jgi:serine/threonine protein kinase
MDESVAKIIMRKLVEGLQSLWKIGFCHRDIKSSNILVNELPPVNGVIDYDVKWIDFGFTWPVDELSTNFPGTTPYMSPEVISQEEPFDCRASDVWALGAVLFRALNGEYPYGGKFYLFWRFIFRF